MFLTKYLRCTIYVKRPWMDVYAWRFLTINFAKLKNVNEQKTSLSTLWDTRNLQHDYHVSFVYYFSFNTIKHNTSVFTRFPLSSVINKTRRNEAQTLQKRKKHTQSTRLRNVIVYIKLYCYGLQCKHVIIEQKQT